MNWDALGAIGEIIGAVAVVVTLIYLATQIRHSVTVASSDALERSTENWIATQTPLLDKELSALFLDGCENYLDLEPAERQRFDVLLSSMLFEFELALEKQQRGLVDANLVATYEFGMRELFQKAGVIQYWKNRKAGHLAVLQEWVQARTDE